MPLALRKRPTGAVGLDIDGSFLAAAAVDGATITSLASAELDPRVAPDGGVADPKALSAAIKELFRIHDLPRRVRLGVANQQIVVRQMEMPMIEDPAERDAAVRFQAAEAIAMPLEDAILDYQPIGATEGPDGTVRQRLLVVAARASMISRLVEAVRGAGLKPDGIDLSAFALVRMLGDNDTDALEIDHTARVICHLGGVTNLAIAAGPVCLFTRPLQTVWSSGDDNLVDSLAEEIRLSIDFHMAQPNARAVTSVVLSGPGATDERVANELAVLTGRSVSVGEPLGILGNNAVPAGDDPARYTVAAGLALGVES